jgi:hypothetical protein
VIRIALHLSVGFLVVYLSLTSALCQSLDNAASGPVSSWCKNHPFALGLGYVLHPLRNGTVTLPEKAQALPGCQRDRVHFFMINGVDPLYLGNLNGLAAYFRSIGFVNTSCWQFPLTCEVGKRITELRQQCPEARIVVLGYSAGANCARSLAQKLGREGIHLDRLIYLGGDTVFDVPESCPENVGRITNITGHGCIALGYDLFCNGDDITGAVNTRLQVRHILLPSRAETIDLIGSELIAVAAECSPPSSRPRPRVWFGTPTCE